MDTTDTMNTANENHDAASAFQSPEQCVCSVLRKRIYASAALGIVPVPLIDFVGLTAIQLDLVRALCEKHNVPFKEHLATGIVSAVAGAAAPVVAARFIFRLLKFVPGFGMGIAGLTLPVLFAASTYTVGKIVDAQLASGNTLEDIDLDRVKERAGKLAEEGKTYARQMVAKVKKRKSEKGDAPSDTTQEQPA